MHRDDLQLYHGMDIQAAFLGVATPELTSVDQLLKEGDTSQWGKLRSFMCFIRRGILPAAFVCICRRRLLQRMPSRMPHLQPENEKRECRAG